MPVKISGLTNSNVDAIRSTLPESIVTTTATTATFHVADPAAAVRDAMDRMPSHRGHPYASLHAVVRKLTRATSK